MGELRSPEFAPSSGTEARSQMKALGMKQPDQRNEETPAEAKAHGREAEKPSRIPRKGWRDILKRTKAEIDDDNMLIIAAGVAFYLLIGIVPGLIAFISIYGLVADPQQVQQQFAALSGFLPAAATDLLSEQMQRIAGDKTTAGWGAGLIFWPHYGRAAVP